MVKSDVKMKKKKNLVSSSGYSKLPLQFNQIKTKQNKTKQNKTKKALIQFRFVQELKKGRTQYRAKTENLILLIPK